MTTRVQEISKKLSTQTEASIKEGLDQIKLIEDFTAEEKIALAGALTSVFYHFTHTERFRALRMSVHVENGIASFGEEVIPFIFNEIIEADGESAAYLGKSFAKIGKPGIDYLLGEWDHHRENRGALINLTQTLSNYKFSEIQEAIPFVLAANKGKNFHLTSMSLCTIGRWIEKSDSTVIDRTLVNNLFDHAFSFLSSTQPLVRRSAVRALGKMCRKKLLCVEREKKTKNAFLAIEGKDGQYSWDDAYIVRKEAELYLKYMEEKPTMTSKYDQSFLILSKRILCANTFHYVIEAPFIAKKIEAGQFIIIRPFESSERIPFSICGWDREKGTLDIIVSAVGKTSTEINRMNEGDEFKDVVGPLGERSHIPKTKGTCVVIGGGYGIGAIIPTAKDLKSAGNKVIGIVGARNQDSLIMVKELKAVCDEVIITTNDGSMGIAGMVTDALKDLLETERINHVLAVGPVPMMNAVGEMTRPDKIETFVSLNAIMVDGTGMCGACRVTVGDETKFACIHGPDFDAHLVDFDNLMKRQRMFVKEEKMAFASMDEVKSVENEQ